MMEDNGISTKISMVRSGSLHTLTTPSNSEQNHQTNREMKKVERYTCGNGEGMFDDEKGYWVTYED